MNKPSSPATSHGSTKKKTVLVVLGALIIFLAAGAAGFLLAGQNDTKSPTPSDNSSTPTNTQSVSLTEAEKTVVHLKDKVAGEQ